MSGASSKGAGVRAGARTGARAGVRLDARGRARGRAHWRARAYGRVRLMDYKTISQRARAPRSQRAPHSLSRCRRHRRPPRAHLHDDRRAHVPRDGSARHGRGPALARHVIVADHLAVAAPHLRAARRGGTVRRGSDRPRRGPGAALARAARRLRSRAAPPTTHQLDRLLGTDARAARVARGAEPARAGCVDGERTRASAQAQAPGKRAIACARSPPFSLARPLTSDSAARPWCARAGRRRSCR